MRLAVLPAAVALVAAAGCRCDGPPPPPPGAEAALRVGSQTYTAAEIDLKRRILECKYPGRDDLRVAAYAQLIENTLILELLGELGRPITEADLDAEVARINRSTRMPDELEALKRLCGGESTSGYRRIAILPDFANGRYFFDVFPRHAEVHRATYETAQGALRDLREGRADPLALAAAGSGSPWRRDDLLFATVRGFYRDDEQERGPRPPDPSLPPEVRPEIEGQETRWAQYEREVFAPTLEGEWHERVIDEGSAWALLRWVGWFGEGSRVRKIERLSLPKKDGHEYLWERAGEIPVWIAGDADRAEFERTIPWASRVRMENRWGP